MPEKDFEQFRAMVLRDPGLQKDLVGIEDRGEFIDRVVALGRLHSFKFGKEDVVQALRAARSPWVENWK